MKILVTGGAGFLGSHLCERLVRDGHDVVAIDDLSTGSSRNVQHLKRERRFRLIEDDITLPLDFLVADLRFRPERIYNLACPASPVHYQRDPIKTVITNVEGTLNVLRLASRIGARILQASTSEVYGDPAVHPQTEQYLGNVNPIGRRACYDEGKRCAETLCFDFHRQAGVDIRVARIFNTYGPRMAIDDGRVVSNFIVQALRGENLAMHGDGTQTRSFCYVDDLIEGCIRLMEHPSARGPINLGNPHEITVRSLAHRVLAITGARSKILRRPRPEDDPVRRLPDIARARQELGWQPRIDLDTGLRRTTDHLRSLLEAEHHLATPSRAAG